MRHMDGPMPLVMRWAMVFAGLFALAVPIVLWSVGTGRFPYLIGGRSVTAKDWWTVAVPMWVLAGVLMGAIACGMRFRKPWSRHVVVLLWATIGCYPLVMGFLGAVPPAIMWRAVAQALALGSVSVWYFYRKSNVVAYFNLLPRYP